MAGYDLGTHLDTFHWDDWAILVLYVLAATTAVAVAVSLHRRGSLGTAGDATDERLAAWIAMAVAGTLLVLAVVKLVGLQELLLGDLRRQAKDAGWYQRRRRYQKLAVALLGIGTLAGIGALLVVRRMRRHALTVISLVGLLGYVAVRSVSYHDIDAALYRRWRYASSTLEAIGIGVVVGCVVVGRRRGRTRHEGVTAPDSGG
jgi:hypothetical protein